MAFQPPTRPDIQNQQKKILEELNLRKQLLKSGTAQTLNPSALNSPIGVSVINSNPTGDNPMPNLARAAHANSLLQHANSTSFGYFITQESLFGNNILAVLPRFNEGK
ncbi:hypothetical protein RUM43_004160 [Polyplax serrata]|uniref:SOSS complex subunit C homolog n=1 Tax=Polyplax serrata TaxID=468196 RepID=A0AAN8SAL7_POLSC